MCYKVLLKVSCSFAILILLLLLRRCHCCYVFSLNLCIVRFQLWMLFSRNSKKKEEWKTTTRKAIKNLNECRFSCVLVFVGILPFFLSCTLSWYKYYIKFACAQRSVLFSTSYISKKPVFKDVRDLNDFSSVWSVAEKFIFPHFSILFISFHLIYVTQISQLKQMQHCM